MKLSQTHTDVTTLSKKYVICHCISSDCAMGKGVVVAINKIHPLMKEYCKRYSDAMNKDVVGTALRYEDLNGVCYNLFSKKNVRDNAINLENGEYYENLKSCLSDLKKQMEKNKEKFLAMPKIGSGLDKGDWDLILSMIKEVFLHTDIEILVCIWGN